MLRRAVPPTLLLACLLALAPAAHALTRGHVRARLAGALGVAGSGAGAYVEDLDTGRRIYARRAGTPLIPASVNKLFVTATALRRWGPRHRLDTVALSRYPMDADGVLRGDLFLRGGGDPTLTSVRLKGLAHRLAAAGLTRVRRVRGDESLFDLRRGSYASGYRLDSEITGELGALTVDRGALGGGFQPSPAAYAAQRFSRALRHAGVDVRRRAGLGTAPPDAVELGASRSVGLAGLLALMDQPSDNFYAETLLKDLGADFGGAGSTPAGARVVRRQMHRLGIHPAIVDGSGLSRADHVTPRDVVRLIAAMADDRHFVDALAVAGRSGTLSARMRHGAAAGRCVGKTGTLSDVSNVAGLCRTRGGDRVAFAFLMNGVYVPTAHTLQDRMVNAVAALR